MAQRLVIGLKDASAAQGVRRALTDLGVDDVVGPRPELPDVLVARPPSDDLERYVRSLSKVEGVAYVEPESIYEAFGE
jgi:hypothetical protein